MVAVIAWAGMRGVVTLAAAYAIPLTKDNGEPLEGRDLVLLCAFAVVLATLLVQGLTLPWLIRRVRLPFDEDQADALAEAQAAQQAAQAAVERLDELAESELPGNAPIVDELRNSAESRANAAWERLGPQDETRLETPSELYRRLRRDMLNEERTVYIQGTRPGPDRRRGAAPGTARAGPGGGDVGSLSPFQVLAGRKLTKIGRLLLRRLLVRRPSRTGRSPAPLSGPWRKLHRPVRRG